MNLDNEENYFTKRMNGAIKDKDVEKAIENVQFLLDYDFKSAYPTYLIDEDKLAIETILNELKYRESKYKELENKDKEILRQKIEKKMSEEADRQLLYKKDKIIDKLLTEITAVNSGRYEYMDNEEVLNIFTKKAEE